MVSGVAEHSDILEALARGAVERPWPSQARLQERGSLPIAGSPAELPPLRYSLLAQTPREELLGEWGVATSIEARLAARAQDVITAAATRPSTLKRCLPRLHAALIELERVRGPDRFGRVIATTDCAARAIVLARALAPDSVARLWRSWMSDQLSHCSDPGEQWTAPVPVSWSRWSGHGSWDSWLGEIDLIRP
jgi:hypothetical protein